MGVKEKKYFFRPDVTFEVDAQWLLNRCEDGKKILRDRPSGSRLPPFRVRYCPQGLREGVQKCGKVLAHAFLCANSVLRWANDFGMPKIDVKPHFLPIPTLICYLFSIFEEQRAISFWKLR